MQLDWSAPIHPGESIAGILFGATLDDVLMALKSYSVDSSSSNVIRFSNSPLLRFQQSNGVLTVRAIEIQKNYDWQDVVMDLDFSGGVLKFAAIHLVHWEGYSYKGKLFDQIGLGDSAELLLNHYDCCTYDDVEEWLYFGGKSKGVRVGGSSCTLQEDPNQLIWQICTAPQWHFWPEELGSGQLHLKKCTGLKKHPWDF